MSADALAMALVVASAFPLNAFPFCLAWISRGVWFRTSTGLALMVSTTGLAALVDITILYKVFGDNYPYRDVVRNTVYAWIALGAWLKFGALIYESRRRR